MAIHFTPVDNARSRIVIGFLRHLSQITHKPSIYKAFKRLCGSEMDSHLLEIGVKKTPNHTIRGFLCFSPIGN